MLSMSRRSRRAVSLNLGLFLDRKLTLSVERCASLKRVHALPREAHTVSAAKNAAQTIVPVRYETTI